MTKSTRAQRDAAPLPGDPAPDREVAAMIRVDHAGEYGAKRIYQGQLAVLGKSRDAPALRRMARQEERHLEAFEKRIAERGVRPTFLFPLWHVGAYAMGYVTARMGEKAAMACTEAVETVIDRHYADQAARLGGREPALRKDIERFRAEEIEHRDMAIARGAREAPNYERLSRVIRGITQTAIKLSTRF
ncbi:MAG: demethoxyubiquinone hydroxylase family protein [Alphaproteobacteria bacterium]|nr:demethoxyubiquinone hydroxylase family protein [Alphaproteobacteria bacterium]